MYLTVAATELEMAPLRRLMQPTWAVAPLVLGVGPVEATLHLTRHLALAPANVSGVVLFGVAGAYINTGLKLLDICLADQETFGDLGICLERQVVGFDDQALALATEFTMDASLLHSASRVLAAEHIAVTSGRFVTVCGTSGTAARGAALQRTHNGLCENMEGAAVARVCREYGLPCLELRCVSNMVEDRDRSRWRLADACQRGAAAVAAILAHLAG